ncbi:HYR domain-containing protein, partial [Lutibacter sp.]|uniref:HYR domain-containing protein n=1 Tax=Lutibacter sp. TaxID=1925666 RepID=UPI0034A01AAE
MKKNYFIGSLFFFVLLVFFQYIGMFVSFFETHINGELLPKNNSQYAYLAKKEPTSIVGFNYFFNEAFEEFVDEREIVKKAKSNAAEVIDKVSFDTGCPVSPITQNNDIGNCFAVVIYTAPTPTPSSGNIVTQIAGLASGSTFPIGSTTNTFEERTSGGAFVVSCSFDVIVTDNEDPTIVGLPSDISVSNDTGVCGAAVTWS